MPSHMKNLALVAAIAGAAIADEGPDYEKPTPANPWEAWPTTTQGPDCKPWYEPYVCDDDNGGEYTTTYTLYSKGCPGYTEWAEWPPKTKDPKPADPWNTWDGKDGKLKPPPGWYEWDDKYGPKPAEWDEWKYKPATWTTWDPPKPTGTWASWDPKPTGTWGSWDPKPTSSWGGWDGKPKAPHWPDYFGPKPDGWDDWKYVPVKPSPPQGWYEWYEHDPKPADWDDWKYQPSKPQPPPGWFEWDDKKGPAPQGWDDWKYIIVVPVWPADKGDKPSGWDDWVYVPSKPSPPKGWFEWDDDKDGKDKKPANWDDWKYVPHPVWPDWKGDKPSGWDEWVYVEEKPDPPPQWYEWDDEKDGKDKKPAYWDDWKSVKPITTAWENYGPKVVTITFVETYKVPCSTGWEYDTTTIYATHCGCTETPVPEKPAYTTIVKSDCPDEWKIGKTVTYSTPVAEQTWNTWAKPAEATTYPDGGKSWGVWTTSTASPVKPTEAAQWSNVAQWKGAAASNGVSKIMVAAAGAVAGLALFL